MSFVIPLLKNYVLRTIFNCCKKYSHGSSKPPLIRAPGTALRIQFLTTVPTVVRMASDSTKKVSSCHNRCENCHF